MSQEEEIKHRQMVEKKMQKEEKLVEFRSFRTSKRRKQRKKQRSIEREDVKTQSCLV